MIKTIIFHDKGPEVLLKDGDLVIGAPQGAKGARAVSGLYEHYHECVHACSTAPPSTLNAKAVVIDTSMWARAALLTFACSLIA